MIVIKKDEKITTNFEAVNIKHVIYKDLLDKKLSEIEAHISNSEKDYNDFKKLSNKQSVEEVLVQRGVKKTIQILF